MHILSKNNKLVKQRQKLILESAIKVFRRKSYTRATMYEIAKAAGMSPGNVYRYIKSKQDILHLICEESKKSIKDFMNSLKSVSNVSVPEYLRQCIRAYAHSCEKWSERHLFFNREIRDFSDTDRGLLLDSQVDYIDFFYKIICKGMAVGKFKTKYPLILAHNIVLLPHDWILRRWYLRQHFSFNEFIEYQIDLIMNSLLSPKGRTGRDSKK